MDETYGTYLDDECFDYHDYEDADYDTDDDTEDYTDDDTKDDTAKLSYAELSCGKLN